MGEEFEDRDLSESVFWGVNLKGSMFRDVDLSDSTMFHVSARKVSIDGIVERLVVNGVDVTDHVNAHDRWYPLRAMLEPQTAEACRDAWTRVSTEWNGLVERAAGMPGAALLESVDGEWSFRDTLRHLVFVRDKWFAGPLLGRSRFTAFGLPNTGSRDLDWPGLDLSLEPPVEEVLAHRGRQNEEFSEWLQTSDFSSLPPESQVLENGAMPTMMCVHAVLEEEFEHLRYALRDLDVLSG
ncbi:MAG: DinB family protein [Ilumatobacteraceae bacterium]